jgi:hypothetical protein
VRNNSAAQVGTQASRFQNYWVAWVKTCEQVEGHSPAPHETYGLESASMTYQFPLYFPFAAIAVGVLLASWTIRLLRKGSSLYSIFVSAALAAVALFVVAPGLHFDRVTMDNEVIIQQVGIWFMPKRVSFNLSKIHHLRIERVNGRRGSMEEWVFRMKDGETERFNPGDLWVRHGDDILARLRDKGIDALR